MEQFFIYSNVTLWVLTLFNLLCVILLMRQFGSLYLNNAESISRDGIPIGDTIPDFTGKKIFENTQISNINIKGKPTLIAFVAASCGACKELIPDWNEIYGKYKDQVNFLLIGLGNEEDYKDWEQKHTIKGEFIVDEDAQLLSKFKGRVTPFAFIVDEDGVVREKGLCNNKGHIKRFISMINSKNDDIKKNNNIRGVESNV